MEERENFRSLLNLKMRERTAAQTKALYDAISSDAGLRPLTRNGPHNYLDTQATYKALFPASSLYGDFSLATTAIAPFSDNVSSPIMFTMAMLYGAGRIYSECPGMAVTTEASMVVGIGEILAPDLPERLRLKQDESRKKLVTVVRALSIASNTLTFIGVNVGDQLVGQGEAIGLKAELRLAVGDANWRSVELTPQEAMQILHFYAEVAMESNALSPVIMLTSNLVAILKKGAITGEFINKINTGMQEDLGFPPDIIKAELVSKIYRAYGNYMTADIARKVITNWQSWIPANTLRLQLTVAQAVGESLKAFTTVEEAVKACPDFSWSRLAALPIYASEMEAYGRAYRTVNGDPYFGFNHDLGPASSRHYRNLASACATLLERAHGDISIFNSRCFNRQFAAKERVNKIIDDYMTRIYLFGAAEEFPCLRSCGPGGPHDNPPPGPPPSGGPGPAPGPSFNFFVDKSNARKSV